MDYVGNPEGLRTGINKSFENETNRKMKESFVKGAVQALGISHSKKLI